MNPEILKMPKRVIVMLDDDLDKKLLQIHAKKIQETTSSVRFSGLINEILRKGFKK